MAHPKKWVLGIDPGFGNTGAVLRLVDEQEVVDAACWYNDNVHDWNVLRAMSIAIPLIERAVALVQENGVECLEVCIEYPVYNGNAKVLMSQMTLYTLLQVYVYDYLVPLVPEVYLSTVNNRTSKKLLAHDGSADKQAMIEASPWAGCDDLTYSQLHTLADSYAHSLSAGRQEWALHKMPQYMVEANFETQ